jgi:predicted metal-dependent HD superfamily phosphohydrolase
MEITNELLRDTAVYIQAYFKSNLPPEYEFHNFTSTVRIVQTCDSLAAQTDLKKQERMKILLAAWFLYSGYGKNPENYQKTSAELASHYLAEKGGSSEFIKEIADLILATIYPQQPVTIQAQILCDAEASRLADKGFFQTLRALRKEKRVSGKGEIQEKEWLKEKMEMLKNHIYFTVFARKLFEKQKQKNSERLQDKMASLESLPMELPKTHPTEKTGNTNEHPLAADVKLERGVESLFRNTSRNQIHLIRLADYKANLIISINSIIISVILSVLVIRLDTNKYLELPTLILILTSVATILIAISATRPKINMHKKNDSKFKDFGDNLLYFGNFQKMSFHKFNQAIKETIVDKDYLYASLTSDIYHQGLMLKKRFKHLNLSYTVFVVGLILSTLAFIFSFLHHVQLI